MKSEQTILIQNREWSVRYNIVITSIDKKSIIWQVQHIHRHEHTHQHHVTLCIALPNRYDKTELIVQKLAELAIDEVLLFPSARSIIREVSDKKLERLYSIAKEAVEQSFGRVIPKISLSKSLDSIIQKNIVDSSLQHILLDHQWQYAKEEISNNNNIYVYIWPEWWFTPQEKDHIVWQQQSLSLCLGETNLRMETAAIIAWWVTKNI
jgi:16S rRNA (uracil1498-N3)-methyltransferase